VLDILSVTAQDLGSCRMTVHDGCGTDSRDLGAKRLALIQ
jgi:hypothetical protein